MNKAELDQLKRESGKVRESSAKTGSTRQS